VRNPALLRKDRNGIANHWSEHGLGHLLNPTDLLIDDGEWIAHVWESIIAGAHGRSREQVADGEQGGAMPHERREFFEHGNGSSRMELDL
jgi:hypothetical protein